MIYFKLWTSTGFPRTEQSLNQINPYHNSDVFCEDTSIETWYIFKKKKIAHDFIFAILFHIHEHMYFLIFSSAEKKHIALQ